MYICVGNPYIFAFASPRNLHAESAAIAEDALRITKIMTENQRPRI
jgi:hypothetical protein